MSTPPHFGPRSPYPAGTTRRFGAVRVLGLAVFVWCCRAPSARPESLAFTPELRVVSYNIRHGRGMDDSVNLGRTAAALRHLGPDLVGLQEVDERVQRSGGVDEADALGRALGMHHTFGAFMPYQGGRYGLAILSRFPVLRTVTVDLPVGNEPRIGLGALVRLPDGDSLMVVNVHFDWVRDDTYRFAQATRLSRWLDSLTVPWILVGDFNDEPGSRTLALFTARAVEVVKSPEARLTFSSRDPVKEIDFVFVAPPERWESLGARAVDERDASDHRPVLARVRRGRAPL